MKLPRRVPWTSIGELEQVCNWIFTDETDLNAQSLAINRVRPAHHAVIFSDLSPARSMEANHRPPPCTRRDPRPPLRPHLRYPSQHKRAGRRLAPPTELCSCPHPARQWPGRPAPARSVRALNRGDCSAARASGLAHRPPSCCNARGAPESGCFARRCTAGASSVSLYVCNRMC